MSRKGKPVPEWMDGYEQIVKPGDEIRFMTLYGTRASQVRAIYEDVDPWFNHPFPKPVIFDIEPVVIEGFEDVFKPIVEVASESMWNPSKWIGRPYTKDEETRAVEALQQRLDKTFHLDRPHIRRDAYTRVFTGTNSAALMEIAGNSHRPTVMFPEIENMLPLHPLILLERLQTMHLVGHDIVTTSDIVCLWLIRMVEKKKLDHDNLEFVWVYSPDKIKTMRLDSEGEFLDQWPYGFFTERGHLLWGIKD